MGQIGLKKLIQPAQRCCRVTAATTKSSSMRNFLLKLDREAAFDFRILKEELCRANDQIVVAGGKRGIVAAEIDPTILVFDLDLVVKRNRRDQRLDFMEAVLSLSKNAQGEINLGRGENFH